MKLSVILFSNKPVSSKNFNEADAFTMLFINVLSKHHFKYC